MGYHLTAQAAVWPRAEGCATTSAHTPRAGVGSGYRYYSRELGRWVNRDPIGERGGLGLYGFVRNMPITGHDYLGLVCCGMEIGAKLEHVVENARRHLQHNRRDRRWACWFARSDPGFGWDLQELFWQGVFVDRQRNCGVGRCAQTVSVHGECYLREDVNYVVWGMLADVCFGGLELAEDLLIAYRTFMGVVFPDDEDKPLDGRRTWTYLGYRQLYRWDDVDPGWREPVDFPRRLNEASVRTIWHGRCNMTSDCPPCGLSYAGTLTIRLSFRGKSLRFTSF